MKNLKEVCKTTVDITSKASLALTCVGFVAAIGSIIIPDSKEKDEKED